MKFDLSLTGKHHKQIYSQLYGNGGSGNFVLALCGSHSGNILKRLLVHEIVLCKAGGESDSEQNGRIASMYAKANKQAKYVAHITADGLSDSGLSPELGAAYQAMLQMRADGYLYGAVLHNRKQVPISIVKLVGYDLCFWTAANTSGTPTLPEFAVRHIQLFGQGTYEKLRNLTVAVIGGSGTGSPTIEQLARLGVGKLILVDPDYLEEKNVNRIINSSITDAKNRVSKVHMLARAVRKMGLGTKVEVYQKDLSNPAVVRAIAGSDVVFGCMDSVDGRHLLNRLATFYLLPYFDIGIKLIADGKGGIEQACGTIHYLQPGGSSLLSRRVYTLDQLFAANLKRTDIDEYNERIKSKYIDGIDEDRPAVISVNMLFAAFAVNEFLARIHPFREDQNEEYSTIRFSLTQGQFYKDNESEPCQALMSHVGRGDVSPLLDMPQLSEEIVI
ncbi:MAG: ThiF family adenylyltransferase [Geobacteraceae bacterium]|nr:ThiF family adenylyltransferase [Geobacteraceae bacterium]NTW80735.1 ThiF family adenylyltransferase [Geobacteraceae bacterium]